MRLTHWRSPWRRGALAAILAALPSVPLAAASDPVPAAKPPTLKAAVRAAVVRDAAVVAAPHARSARADQSGSSKQSPGFFRSKPGAVALAVMVVGTGYALYSASHDKINSPGKK